MGGCCLVRVAASSCHLVKAPTAGTVWRLLLQHGCRAAAAGPAGLGALQHPCCQARACSSRPCPCPPPQPTACPSAATPESCSGRGRGASRSRAHAGAVPRWARRAVLRARHSSWISGAGHVMHLYEFCGAPRSLPMPTQHHKEQNEGPTLSPCAATTTFSSCPPSWWCCRWAGAGARGGGRKAQGRSRGLGRERCRAINECMCVHVYAESGRVGAAPRCAGAIARAGPALAPGGSHRAGSRAPWVGQGRQPSPPPPTAQLVCPT